MKIAYLIKEDLLKDELMANTLDQETERHCFQNPSEIIDALKGGKWDFIIISGLHFNLGSFHEFVEMMKEHPNYDSKQPVIILSNKHPAKLNEQIVKYCLSNGLSYIPSGLDVPNIINRLNEMIYGMESFDLMNRKKIVLFMGSTPNIGTTLAAFGTAIRTAKETDQSIAYICLNLKSSKIHRYMGMDEPEVTLDSIRAELKSQSLSRDKLRMICHKVKEAPNLSVLFGNMLREQAEFFTPQDIQYLLQIASDSFDLCFVEVNAYWDNAATICGILFADTKVLVTTKELGHFQEDLFRWVKSTSPLLEIDPRSFDLFITKQEAALGSGSGVSGYSIKDIRKETAMNIIGGMSCYPEVYDYLNRGRIVELLLTNQSIIHDFAGITNTLTTLYGLRKGTGQIAKSWYKRFWFGIKTGA